MKIGIVTTWFERGAAYVSKLYRNALESKGNEVFIYVRGGERSDKEEWNDEKVTYGYKLPYTYINKKDILSWVDNNDIEIVFFNEQHEFSIVAELKKSRPQIKLGSYIDYYKEDTVQLFDIYDFIICNTHRHMEAMKNHKQSYFVKWGTDTNLFVPVDHKHNDIVFFHSMGMSFRKGTKILLEAFVKGKLYEKSRLIIHSQLPVDKITDYSIETLKSMNIEIISQTVTAPGLYHLGDVYVYPTYLDGLGLTMYEALSCGLPVIATNNGPMNEIVEDKFNGRLIEVEKYYSRADGYYWPLSVCNINSLIECMNYYIENKENIEKYKKDAREYAIKNVNFEDRYDEINNIFTEAKIYDLNNELYQEIIKKEKKERKSTLLRSISTNSRFFSFIWSRIK